eukprot:UN02186
MKSIGHALRFSTTLITLHPHVDFYHMRLTLCLFNHV